MKLLHSFGPNPRIVRMFMLEKGITLPSEEVDILAGDNRKEGFLKRNPAGQSPALELDDGTCIGEAMAICRYFEELHPNPPLMGTDAKDKAIVEMWEKRANEEGMLAASELFRNTHPAFADRGLPGSAQPIGQLPELVVRAKARLGRFFKKFDAQLAQNEFVAGQRYSVADPYLLVFWTWGRGPVLGFDMPRDFPNWTAHARRMAKRPAVQRAFAREEIALPA